MRPHANDARLPARTSRPRGETHRISFARARPYPHCGYGRGTRAPGTGAQKNISGAKIFEGAHKRPACAAKKEERPSGKEAAFCAKILPVVHRMWISPVKMWTNGQMRPQKNSCARRLCTLCAPSINNRAVEKPAPPPACRKKRTHVKSSRLSAAVSMLFCIDPFSLVSGFTSIAAFFPAVRAEYLP